MTQTTHADARTLSLEAGYDRLAGLMTACGESWDCHRCSCEEGHRLNCPAGMSTSRQVTLQPCRSCNGTGEVALLPGLRGDCRHCYGSGFWGSPGSVKCSECKGRKWVPVRDFATLLAEMRRAGWVVYIEIGLDQTWVMIHTPDDRIKESILDGNAELACVRAACLATDARG